VSIAEVQREHVVAVMRQADRVGRQEFVRVNGFGFATSYLLRHDGHFYDPKAVVGVAHGLVDGNAPLTAESFDSTQAIARLRALDFEVVDFSRLWWVNQGSTFRQERAGGYVWAPKVTKRGTPVGHHTAVNELRTGDLILHYKDGHVRAIGRVRANPESMSRPGDLPDDAWEDDGYGCRVDYRDLTDPIALSELPNRQATVGPFDVNGGAKQGYLFPIDNGELFPLLEYLSQRLPALFDSSVPRDRPATVEARAGAVATELPDDPIHVLLVRSKNMVLEGVPGTGKSFAIERLAESWAARTGRELLRFGGQPFAVQVMHPSSSYEDFIEGIRPRSSTSAVGTTWFDAPVGTSSDFVVEDGFFLRVCSAAASRPDCDVLVLLDEFNRCNVPSVLGDLLLTLEASRRATYQGGNPRAATAKDWRTAVPVQLPYSGRLFFVPDNVYLVATINTTDRSVASLDAAIRRRFAFYRIEPEFEGVLDEASALEPRGAAAVRTAVGLVQRVNGVLLRCIGADALLGPSYLYDLCRSLREADESVVETQVARVWQYNVIPQLVDGLRSYGAEDLLAPETRRAWFTDHGDELSGRPDPSEEFAALDGYLRSIGLGIEVNGTGLARGARLVSRVDVSWTQPDLAVELADGPQA